MRLWCFCKEDTLLFTVSIYCKHMILDNWKQGPRSTCVVHTICLVAGVALTFEKLRIANAQHGKNCVSSPAAKTTISTDLPKICHDRAGLQTAHRPFWLSHQQYIGTSIPSPGWEGGGGGEGAGKSKMFRPTASALQTFSARCKKKKRKD